MRGETQKRIAINAWLYPGKDDVMIEWWQALPKGDRAPIVVRALEHYANLPPESRRDSTEQLITEIRALRHAIENLPALIVGQIRDALKAITFRLPVSSDEEDTTEVATPEALSRRRENRRKHVW